MNAPVLDIRGLTIVRDGTVILRDLSWRVEPGQHWVVLGANGSGKTSLLAALTGYLMPTSGEITLLGHSEPALFTVASGKHAMIDFWGTPSRADRARAKELLALTECVPLADRPWAVLSQGERQRVLIGRALMARPKLLILDEPCAGLDPVAREHFLQFLGRLARTPDGPTLVFVTHHVEEITPVFSHALLLRAGAVTASGGLRRTLTSERLGELFGGACTLSRTAGRHSLRVRSRTSRAM